MYISNIWKLNMIRFFYHLIPAYVIERLYWEERGMTIQLVILTEIIFAATVVLFEVPTGIIADKWGRKRMIVLASFIGCLEFFILVFATEFWHFALVVFLAAIGSAASSGAENALLYDSLLHNGKEQHFEKYAGRLNAIDTVSIMIAALSGSLLASHYGFEFNYWLSLISMIVALVLSFLIVEPNVRSPEENEETIPIRQYLTASLSFFRSHSDVSLVVLVGMVTGASINYIDEFWQIYLERLHIPVYFFGIFSATIFFIRMPGNIFAYKLKYRFSYRFLLAFSLLVFTAGFFYISMVKDYSGLVVIVMICCFAGLIEPLASGYLHHRIDSTMRATMDSFQSLGQNVLKALTGLGFGYYSSKLDIFGGFGFIGMICGLYLVYFLAQSKKITE
ncbi:MFS transporter [Paenibacillus sp. GSMTC-2017]|uniref:MFS transporter n=1 Tax=Paenibacillus sp. GSMTC-2017 TaxID=2794350 RepID=UPI0018D8B760|nr:MFS transporter [Paenibacillus sp. GSMTC-2017]MBH5319973.1 MFS transporter [Paenibacillus sp. GSMTC-2017]